MRDHTCPPLPSTDLEIVAAWDAIRSPQDVTGPALIADWGGGWDGLDAAERLAGAGREVTLACAGLVPGETLHQYQRNLYLSRLDEQRITILHHHELALDTRALELRHVFSGARKPLPDVAPLVLAQGRVPADELWAELESHPARCASAMCSGRARWRRRCSKVRGGHPRTGHQRRRDGGGVMAKRIGGHLVAESLAALGAETAFGVPGDPRAADLGGPARRAAVGLRDAHRAVPPASPPTATPVAQRQPAPLLLSTGPGALNSLTALMEAASSHVPVVAISSQIPSASHRARARLPA